MKKLARRGSVVWEARKRDFKKIFWNYEISFPLTAAWISWFYKFSSISLIFIGRHTVDNSVQRSRCTAGDGVKMASILVVKTVENSVTSTNAVTALYAHPRWSRQGPKCRWPMSNHWVRSNTSTQHTRQVQPKRIYGGHCGVGKSGRIGCVDWG